MYLLAILVFIFGTIIGSFLNVVILRYNTGMPIFGARERSRCFSCGKKLAPHELVPIFSFLFLLGRCSRCKSKISWQYPIVEFITGLIFLLVSIKNLPVLVQNDSVNFLWQFLAITIFHLVIWSIFIVITFYDLKHKIIPNGLVYSLIFLTLIGSGFVLWNFLAGLIFFTFFFSLWFFSGGRWIGFGDAKLSLAVGFLLGVVHGISALILAFWIGAAVSISMIFLGAIFQKIPSKAIRNSYLLAIAKNLTIKSEIPFAPFIILGTCIVFFMGFDILGLSHIF